MKTNLYTLTMFLVIALIGIICAGCATQATQDVPTSTPPPPTPIPPTPEVTTDPLSATVMEMVARVNAGDFAGAAELFADDGMVYLVGMPPTGMEIYRGKEQFRTFLEECCTDQNFVWEVTPERVEDGVVFAEAKTWMDFTRDLGVAPNSFHEVFVVQNGKITLYYSTITQDALANFKPVLFEAIPELAAAVQPPADSNETPVNEISVTLTNDTCAYDGPMTLQAGELIVNVDVQDARFERYALTFFTLDEGKDLIDLMASTYNPSPPSWSDMVFIKELTPGESQTFDGFYVKAGLLYMVCWAGPPDLPIGNAGPFLVKE
ncbi:MAG TPA: hypothetical protein DEH25_16190 [Chloroflexi bacterium]|nr:hypothetical protein [Chloroflexota bacterium]HBY07272.1 hypothetical protein [Chloroflexota bacterium]